MHHQQLGSVNMKQFCKWDLVFCLWELPFSGRLYGFYHPFEHKSSRYLIKPFSTRKNSDRSLMWSDEYLVSWLCCMIFDGLVFFFSSPQATWQVLTYASKSEILVLIGTACAVALNFITPLYLCFKLEKSQNPNIPVKCVFWFCFWFHS